VHCAVNVEFSNNFQVNLSLFCRSTVQDISCRHLTKEVRVRYQISLCEIFGEQNCTRSGFLRVLQLTFPNDINKLQHIVNPYEQDKGIQFNRRKSKPLIMVGWDTSMKSKSSVYASESLLLTQAIVFNGSSSIHPSTLHTRGTYETYALYKEFASFIPNYLAKYGILHSPHIGFVVEVPGLSGSVKFFGGSCCHR
jgi:hypothetical protein